MNLILPNGLDSLWTNKYNRHMIEYIITVQINDDWQEFQYPSTASPELSWRDWQQATAIITYLDQHYPGWQYYEVDYEFEPEQRQPPLADQNDHPDPDDF